MKIQIISIVLISLHRQSDASLSVLTWAITSEVQQGYQINQLGPAKAVTSELSTLYQLVQGFPNFFSQTPIAEKGYFLQFHTYGHRV